MSETRYSVTDIGEGRFEVWDSQTNCARMRTDYRHLAEREATLLEADHRSHLREEWIADNFDTIDALIAGTLVAVPVEPDDARLSKAQAVVALTIDKLREVYRAMIAEHGKGRVG